MQQALDYVEAIKAAKMLDVPFAYSSNGDGFIEHDMKTGNERELSMDEFPSPEDLWHRYIANEKLSTEQESLITEPYYFGGKDKTPRYYQRIAIN